MSGYKCNTLLISYKFSHTQSTFLLTVENNTSYFRKVKFFLLQVAGQLRQQQLSQGHPKSNPTTEHPSTTLEPYQPPLSVYMGPKEGHNVKISDVVKVLKEAKTISVLDTVGPGSPQVFVGPSNLQIPEDYAKFELPYLSALESNRIESKLNKLPFFVAPLSFMPPPGYSKIPFPAPHVGSVVVSNVTENILHEKDSTRKTYSLPAELPPINPELPSLVNSLQDHHSVLLLPQKQEVTKLIEAVKHVGLETSTERYTRNKQFRQPYQDTETTTTSVRVPNKHARHRFQQPPTQYEQETVTTVQPQYLEKTKARQPPYPEFEGQSNQSHHHIIQAEISTRQTQAAVHEPKEVLPEKGFTNSQVHAYKTIPLSTQENLPRRVTTTYYKAEEESSTQQPQYVTSDATFPDKQVSYDIPLKELQYPHLESVVITESPAYTISEGNIPIDQAQYRVPDTYINPKYGIIREIPPERAQNIEPYSGIPKYTTAQDIIPQRETQHPFLESSAKPSQYEKPLDAVLGQPHYSQREQSGQRKPSTHTSQDFLNLEPTAPVNTKYVVPERESPQHEPQNTVLRLSAATKSTNYHRAQDDILLRPESGDEHIYKTPQHRFQYPAPDTENQDKQSKQTVTQEKVPAFQSQYQIKKIAATTKQPQYSKPQGIPSHVMQYTVPPDTLQSQYPVLDAEVLTESVLASTTTAAPVRETSPRGRSRGRYRPSSISTTTAPTRTRSSYSRGRRPVTRTTSEASTADQINTFESSRQPSGRSQSETQRRERTRTRSRGRSTTTSTTVSPQYKTDVHQGDLYPPTGATQHSEMSTTTETFPHRSSVYQQHFRGHVSHTQIPTGQAAFRQPSSSQIPQSHNGKIPQNQFSNFQVLNTDLPSGSNSGETFTYAQIPNEKISQSRIPNEQVPFGQDPNRSEAQQHIFIGQTAHAQGLTHKLDYSQLHSGQSTHPKIQSEPLNKTKVHNTQIIRQHISSGQVNHSQMPSGQMIVTQFPSQNASSNDYLREEAVYTQVPSPQPVILKIPDGFDNQPVTSMVNKHLSSAPSLSNMEILEQDEFLLHELPMSTTERQHSTLPNAKYQTREVSSFVYQTTLPSPAHEGKYTEQGDYQIVTSNRDTKGEDGSVTDKPSFVRIRGRVRGRPRIVQQPVEQITTATTATPELQTAIVGRKQTNFLNRDSARKTQAPTTTPTPETTKPVNDKVRHPEKWFKH
jgi:hypothetical protein